MNLKFFSLFTVLFLLTNSSNALDSDRQQPIRIQADAATVDEKAGISIYKGNVLILQGTLRLTADEVEIYTAESEVIQIIAKAANDKGMFAKYEQRTEDSKALVRAEAQIITYLVQEERLHLSGSAKLWQAEDTFTGELLFYDLGRRIVNLNSDGNKSRVNMTITPKKSSDQ